MSMMNLPPELSHPAHAELLSLIALHRFATSRQLARAMSPQYASMRSAVRQTNRHLASLKEHGLTQALERRIGGWQSGSGQHIWTPTMRGYKVATGRSRRHRTELLSTTFVAHCLAVTETVIAAQEVAHEHQLTLKITSEPECWRSYPGGPFGQPQTLKPDLHLWMEDTGLQYSAFVEVDRATENPARVITKCQQYHSYYRTGLEDRGELFPEVLWVVPSQKRAEQLRRHIEATKGLIPEMFAVIKLTGLADALRHRVSDAADSKHE